MHESYRPDQRVDTAALDRFLGEQAEELTAALRPVMNDAFYGIPNPHLARGKEGDYESLLFRDINRPSVLADDVFEPLVATLTHRHGLKVEPAELPYDHLGVYTGGAIRYRHELTGNLKASVLAHEAGHHFGKHIPHEETDPGQEAIAESAAMIALSSFGIDTSRVSLPEIARYIARTAETNGFQLWSPTQEGIPLGMRHAQAAAREIVLAVEAARVSRGLR